MGYTIGSAAPSSKVMPSGIFQAARAATTTRSAKAPSGVESSTRSPLAKPFTSSATSATTPAASAPGMKGNGGFTW